MIPYEKLVEKILAQTKKPREEIDSLIEKKLAEFSGLISKDGAAHIIANEFAVSIDVNEPLTISQLTATTKTATVIVTVAKKYEPSTFNRQNGGGQGRVCSFLVVDPTGTTRLTFWNDDLVYTDQFSEGKTYSLSNVSVKDNRGKIELTYSSRSKSQEVAQGPFAFASLNSSSSPVGQNTQSSAKKPIDALTVADSNALCSGIIVQLFKPTYYMLDKATRKKAQVDQTAFDPTLHEFAGVMNLVIDDGTQTLRVVCFRETAAALCCLSVAQFLELRLDMSAFDRLRVKLLGANVEVAGRVVQNQMYERLELVSTSIKQLTD